MNVEEKDQGLLDAIIRAPDWPTTVRLMHERDTWWRSVRRWCQDCKAWVETTHQHVEAAAGDREA